MINASKEITAVVVLLTCFALFGFVYGQKVGQEVACQSVKTEWVKDKCMKVTREEVK